MFKKLFKRNAPKHIVVVSGLPRSGTSMMMKMLEAGGLEPVQDGIRRADGDNPRGYYEFEQVKQLDKGDATWLPRAVGKSVKVISALLVHLPDGYQYKVLFMQRNIDEVLASQSKMLVNRDEQKTVDDASLKEMYRKHLLHAFKWTARKPNVDVIDVDYNDMVRNPQALIPRVNAFLGGALDTAAMSAVVDPTLHRNRAS